MKILLQHSNKLPVLKYGGIERMIYWHMKELVKLGHQVTLIGHPDSEVSSIGVNLIKCNNPDQWQDYIPNSIDIIHLFYSVKNVKDYPLIISMGCNGQIGEKFHKNSVFVSKKHAENHNSNCYIYNGIDFDEYPFSPKNKSWENFCFLAKGNWSVKNLKDTVRSCKQAHKNLNIMGGRTYIPNRFIKNYGQVNSEQKIKILNKSDALIFPVRWHEPFGLAVIEAMSQGLPAITSSYGSLPELVTKDTGIICNNYEQLLMSLIKEHNFNPELIRDYAFNNFSIQNFSNKFINNYQKVVDGITLNKQNPTWSLSKSPESLLPF